MQIFIERHTAGNDGVDLLVLQRGDHGLTGIKKYGLVSKRIFSGYLAQNFSLKIAFQNADLQSVKALIVVIVDPVIIVANVHDHVFNADGQ